MTELALSLEDNSVLSEPDERIIREQIARLEAALIEEVGSGRMPEADLPLKHTFTEGVYAREMFLPAGTVVVGKIHRHEHLNFISSGRVTVLTKEGLKHLTGPCTMVSPAGVKRAVLVHEDCVWTTIHANPTNERDLTKIEEFTIARSYDELAAPVATLKLERSAV